MQIDCGSGVAFCAGRDSVTGQPGAGQHWGYQGKGDCGSGGCSPSSRIYYARSGRWRPDHTGMCRASRCNSTEHPELSYGESFQARPAHW